MGLLKTIKNLFASSKKKEEKTAGTTSQSSPASGRTVVVGKSLVKLPAATDTKTDTKSRKSGTTESKSGSTGQKSGTGSTKTDNTAEKKSTGTRNNGTSSDGTKVAVGKTSVTLPKTGETKKTETSLSSAWQNHKEKMQQKQLEGIQKQKERQQDGPVTEGNSIAAIVNRGLQGFNEKQQEKNAAEKAEKQQEYQLEMLYGAVQTYEKQLTALKNKAERDPESITQADVDQYNTWWEQYQTVIGNYNNVVEKIQTKQAQKEQDQQKIRAALGLDAGIVDAPQAGNQSVFDIDPQKYAQDVEKTNEGASVAAQQLRAQMPKTLAAIGTAGVAGAQDALANAMGLGENIVWALSPGAQKDAASAADHAKQVQAWKAEQQNAKDKMQKAFELTEDDQLGQFLVELNYNFVQQGAAMVAGGAIGKAGGTALRAAGGAYKAAGANMAGKIGSQAAKRAAAAADLSGKALQGAAKYLQKNAGLATMATLAGSTNYQAAIEGGASNEQAMAYAVLTAAAETVTEKLFGGNPLMDNESGLVNRALYKMLGDRKFLKALDSMPVEVFNEGFEEVIANYLYSGAQAVTGQKVELPTARENLHSFALGAAMGGIGQATKAASGTVNQALEDREIGKKLQEMGAADELIATGLELPGSRAQMRAKELQMKGSLPTARELGRQYRENVAAQKLLTARQMDTERTVRQMAQDVGAQVVFDDTIADAAGKENAANGYYQSGVLHISRDADQPAIVVAKHELTHYLQQAAQAEYIAFRAYAMSLQGENAVQEMQERYARGGVMLSEEEAMDEIAADFTEQLLTDSESIKQLINTNPTLADRFLAALREFLQKLTGRVDPKLKKAEQLWTEAYKAAQGNKNTVREGGEKRYSFGGQNAGTADVEKLNRAVELQRDGADMERIRKETGWYIGADGKWRFEIDDSGMKYHRGGDAAFSRNHPEYAEYQNLTQKMLYGTLTAEEQSRLMELNDVWGREYGRLSERVDRGNATLEDILDHEALFEAYPQLRETKVVFAELPDGTRGQYDDRDNTIRLSKELRTAPEDTLIHEIQHVIQYQEGFAVGSSPEYWAVRDAESGEIKKRLRMQRRDLFHGLSREDQNKYTRYQELERELERLTYAEDGTEEGDLYVRFDKESDKLYLELWGKEWFQKLSTLDRKLESGMGEEYRKLYYNTAGEIEARDAANRRTMTQEQRRETKPDTGDENTVFAEDEGIGWMSSEAYNPETASIKEQIENSREKLNRMDVVARATVPKNFKKKDEAAKWVAEQLKNTGYHVDRQGYGEIYFSKKDIDKGLRYADTPEEKAALAVLPQVLKRGIEIGGHAEHKERKKQTITFAAPVELNGIRGNMGVVVNRNGNHYYAHRIVLPDGTAFKFSEENENAAQELSRGVTVSGSLADTTSTASNANIAQEDAGSKKKFSMKSDSEGRKLTEQQREYFKDSKVRDDEGNLIPVYHATNDDFTVFDRGKLGKITDANAFDEILASTAHVGFWFNSGDIRSKTRQKRLEEVYLNIKRPYYAGSVEQLGYDIWDTIDEGDPAERAEGFKNWLEWNKYDGIIVYDEEFGGTSFVALYPEQIKRITNTNPTENSDIRFSMKRDSADLKSMREERKQVREQIGHLEWLEERDGALTDNDAKTLAGLRTRERELNERIDAANRAAKSQHGTEAERILKKGEKEAAAVRPTEAKKTLRSSLLDTFSIQAGSRKALGAKIDDVAEQILQKGYASASDEAELFRSLYNAGIVVDTTSSREYAEIRNDLKGVKIYVDPDVRAELGDSWNDVLNQARENKIMLTTQEGEGIGIDVEHASLADTYPGMFDSYATDRTEMLEQMLRAAELGRPEHISLMESAMREGGEDAVAQQMMFFDKYLTNALTNLSEQAGFEMRIKQGEILKSAKLRAATADAVEKQSRRKALQEAQNKTLRVFQQLRKMRKTENAETQKLIDELVGGFDTMAKSLRKDKEATWRNLRDIYEAKKREDPNFLPDKDLEAKFARLDQIRIGEMSREEAVELYRAGTQLIHDIRTANKEIAEKNARDLSKLYEDSVAEIRSSQGDLREYSKTEKGREKLKGVKRRYWNEEQLSPMNYIEKMGGWRRDGEFYSMAKKLERGEYDKQRFIVHSDALMEKFTKENADWIAKADGKGKDAIWYEVEVPAIFVRGRGNERIEEMKTVKVAMTPMMKVKLYLDSLSYDNLRHIRYGGATFPDRKLYAAGNTKAAYAQGTTVKLQPEIVKNLVKDLTPQEKELARIIGDQYFNGYAKEEINRVSNLLVGYDKAMADYYSPIFTNHNFLSNNVDAAIMDATIEGGGMLKNRIWSGTPSLAVSVMDAYEQHRDFTAKYVGLAIPVRNMNALLNYTEAGYMDSMREVISKKWGADSVKYLDDLLVNLQNKPAAETTILDDAINKVLNNYVTAVFGFNPGTVVKQAPGFYVAGARLGFDTMPATSLFLPSLSKYRDLIGKYTPLLEWRARGYSSREMAELRNNPNWTQKNAATRFIFGGAIQWMDLHTCAAVWPWAENYVKKHYPELKPGSKAQIDAGKDPFYQKVAEVFEDAIANSQPMYDDMHTAKILHTNKGVARSITMFHTAQMTQANAIRQAHGELKRAMEDAKKQPTKENTAAVKQGQRALVNGVTALLVSTLGFEAVGALVAVLKRKDKALRDEDGELTPESVGKYMADATVKDLLGNIVGWDTAYDLGTHVFFGETWYGFEMPGMDVIEDLIDDAAALKKAGQAFMGGISDVSDTGEFRYYLKTGGSDLRKSLKNIGMDLSYIFGVPAKNMETYTLGLMGWINPELAAAYDNATGEYTKATMAGLKGKPREQQAALRQILKNRAADVSDEAVEELQRLYGTAGTEILPSAVPGSVNVKTGEDTSEEVKLTNKQKVDYKAAYSKTVSDGLNELVTSKAYQKLDDEQKAGAVAMLYQYASEQGKAAAVDGYEPTGWKSKAADAAREGASISQMMIYKAATAEIVSEKDENGNAIDGSTARQKADWLQSSGWSEDAQAAIYFADAASESRLKNRDDLMQQGVGQEQYFRYLAGTKDVEAEKDENGDTIDGSTARQKAEWLQGSGWSEEAQAAIYFEDAASDSKIEHRDALSEQGVSQTVYYRYLTEAATVEPDYDENGKTVNGSKNKKLFELIDGMDLTEDQKTAIYLSDVNKLEDDKGNAKYTEAVDAGISLYDYVKFTAETGAMANVKDSSGKTVKAKRDQVLAYINSMNLSSAQKDILYYDAGYKESTISDAPWRGGSVKTGSAGSKKAATAAKKAAAREAAANSPAVQKLLSRGGYVTASLPKAGEPARTGTLPKAGEMDAVQRLLSRGGYADGTDAVQRYLQKYGG